MSGVDMEAGAEVIAHPAAGRVLVAGELIGHNGPPVDLEAIPDPHHAWAVHIDGLYTETRNWADGAALTSQAQADEISFLIDQLTKARKGADAERVKEKEPHLTASRAVDAKWKPLDSQAELAVKSAKATLQPWLVELARQQAETARLAREAADKLAAEAVEKRRIADATNLDAQADAKAAEEAATEAAKGAKKAEGAKAHATGGTRALGLRSDWTAYLTDGPAAAAHYWIARRAECEAFFQAMADKDVREGVRSIPGYDVKEEKVL